MSYLKTLLETESSAYCAHRSNMAAVLRSVCMCIYNHCSQTPISKTPHRKKRYNSTNCFLLKNIRNHSLQV